MTTRSFYKAAPDYGHCVDDPMHGHPIDGPMRAKGFWWTDDHITYRMLRDGVIVKADETPPVPAEDTNPADVFGAGQGRRAGRK